MRRQRLALWLGGLAVALAAVALGIGLHHARAPVPAAADALRRGGLAGVAVDRLGAPIGGARVIAFRAGREVGRAETTAEGRYWIAVAGRAPLQVRVEAAGFRPEELTEAPNGNELQVVLLRQRALEGVTRMNGRPLGGVELVLGGAAGTRTARSGPDGAFTFADLVEGRYALRATAANGAAAYLPSVSLGRTGEAVDAKDGGEAGDRIVAVELVPGHRLLGTLVDARGRPIAGGEVSLAEGVGAPLPRRAITDERGRFAFVAVLGGAYVLQARASGFQPGDPHPARVPGPAVELTLERGATLTGRVIDEEGRPVAGAELAISGEDEGGAALAITGSTAANPGGSAAPAQLEPAGELGVLHGPIPYPPLRPAPAAVDAGAGNSGSFITDAHGSFRIEGLPAGRLVVAATHPAYARGATSPLAVATGATVDVEIVLHAGLEVRGRVTDPDGQPIEGAEVVTAGGLAAATDPEGDYELGHVIAKSTLKVRASGFQAASRPAAEEVDFQLARADARIAGAVVDPTGQPIARARVEARPCPAGALRDGGLAPARSVFADRDGRFSIEGLPAGPYCLEARARGFAPARVEGVAAGDGLSITLGPGGGLAGTVADARTGAPPGAVQVELSVAGRRRRLPVADGRFSAVALAPGPVHLEVSAPGYVTWSRDFEVPAGASPEQITLDGIEVDLDRAGTVRGQVRDEDGRPVAAAVECGPIHARADGRGRFRCEGVPPGELTVRATAGARAGLERTEVHEDEEQRVTVVVQ